MLPFEVQQLLKGHKDLNEFVRNDLLNNIRNLMIEINEIKQRIDSLEDNIDQMKGGDE